MFQKWRFLQRRTFASLTAELEGQGAVDVDAQAEVEVEVHTVRVSEMVVPTAEDFLSI